MKRSKTPDEFLAQPYGRLLVREPEGGFTAEILEFPGCIAEGDTADEAVANVERAAAAWIDSEIELKHKIPSPASGDDYSGRLLVRLPRSLHRSLALKAAQDNTSINQEVVAAVSCWVGTDDLYRRLTETHGNTVVVMGAGVSTGVAWSAVPAWGEQRSFEDSIVAALRQPQQQPQSRDVLAMLSGAER